MPARRPRAAARRRSRALSRRCAAPRIRTPPPVRTQPTRRDFARSWHAGSRRSASAPTAARAEPAQRPRQRDEGHAPHARGAARDAGLERHVAPLAGAGGHAQGAGAARHHAGSRQLAGRARFPRELELLRGAPLRARHHRAHRRRSPAIAGWRRAACVAFAGPPAPARPRCSPSSRRAGCCAMARAASRSCRPTPCASARMNRCTCWDACSASPRTTSIDVGRAARTAVRTAGQQFVMIDTAGASPRDPELARRLRLLASGAGQHRNLAGAAGQHPGRRHRRSDAAFRARAAQRPA